MALFRVWIVPDGTAAPFELCGGTRVATSPDELRISRGLAVQSTNRFRADTKRFRSRRNKDVSVTFHTSRLFENDAEATRFILLHAKNLPEDGTLYFDQSGADGTVKCKMEHAVISAADSSQKGRSTFHSYTIVGGVIESATI